MSRFLVQHLDHGNQERERLAGSGLGGSNHVFAFECGWMARSWMGVNW